MCVIMSIMILFSIDYFITFELFMIADTFHIVFADLVLVLIKVIIAIVSFCEYNCIDSLFIIGNNPFQK